MVTISVVIVNYNVKYFLARCVESVLKSNTQYEIEIIIIDNASSDNSQSYIKSKFNIDINYTYLSENRGFAKANNIGFTKAKGEYIIILNPDTIIAEDTIDKCINYLIENPKAGALGARMIDGSGQFLNESKRSSPTPWNALCKFAGLSKIFPQTKLFDSYSLGYLKERELAEVDVLCGAFIVTRRTIVEKIGGFDEAYFMYGEDIDFSNRINTLGFQTIYFPNTTIIHFKGESSKRTSVSYTKHFFNAMLIYIKKNKKGIDGFFTELLLKSSILCIGLISFLKRSILELWPLGLDAFILFESFEYLRSWWGEVIFNNQIYFNNSASTYNSVGAVLIWIFSIWFFGHYDSKWKANRLQRGILIGTLIILVIYSLLPSNLRSSRAMILLGTIPLGIITYITHLIRQVAKNFNSRKYKYKYLLLGKEEDLQVLEKQIDEKIEKVSIDTASINITDYENLIINSERYTNKEVIELMDSLFKHKKILISGGGNSYLIQSEKSTSQGKSLDTYSTAVLSESYSLRLKRMFDIIFAIYLMILSPIHGKETRKKLSKMYLPILTGEKTWVGYSRRDEEDLPRIREGVFTTQCLIKNNIIYPELQNLEVADIYYAVNYSLILDYKIVSQNIKA